MSGRVTVESSMTQCECLILARCGQAELTKLTQTMPSRCDSRLREKLALMRGRVTSAQGEL